MNARQLIEAETPKKVLRAAAAARKPSGEYERGVFQPFEDEWQRGPGFYIEVAADGDMPQSELGEGPWPTLEDAQEFFNAEVGVTCRIVFVDDMNRQFPATNWMQP